MRTHWTAELFRSIESIASCDIDITIDENQNIA